MTDTISPRFFQINHITKTFPKVVALDDVSLAAAPGKIHAVLGKEYAGKTTLMRILGGLYAAESYQGEILLDGKPLAARTQRDAIERGVTVVRAGSNSLTISVWPRTSRWGILAARVL